MGECEELRFWKLRNDEFVWRDMGSGKGKI